MKKVTLSVWLLGIIGCASHATHKELFELRVENQKLKNEVQESQNQILVLQDRLNQEVQWKAPKVEPEKTIPSSVGEASSVSQFKRETHEVSEFLGLGTLQSPTKLKYTNKDLFPTLPAVVVSPASRKEAPIKSIKSEKEIEEATALYNEAYAKFNQNDFAVAKQKLLKFVELYPTHAYTDNALYLIGLGHQKQNELDVAIGYYHQVVEQFPTGAKTPEALFAIGMCQRQLNKPTLALETFGQLGKKFPTSFAAQKAKAVVLNMKPGVSNE